MEPWEDCRKKRSQTIYIILLNPFLDVILEGDGDAPTTEDEVSVEGSEVECEHVSGE